jgi:hypothetical protein
MLTFFKININFFLICVKKNIQEYKIEILDITLHNTQH